MEPGLVFPSASLAGVTVTLRATLDNGQTVIVPSHELVRPVRGLDQAGKPKVNTNFTEFAIYDGEAPEDAIVLGKAFLSTVRRSPPFPMKRPGLTRRCKLYLFVDYETMKFKLAKQNLGASVPLAKSSASCTPQSNLSTADKGLIAGLTVLGAIVLGFLAYKLYRRFTHRESKPDAPPPTTTPAVAGGGKGEVAIRKKPTMQSGRGVLSPAKEGGG